MGQLKMQFRGNYKRPERPLLKYYGSGWQRIERPFRTNSGGRAVECLWLNTAVQKAGVV